MSVYVGNVILATIWMFLVGYLSIGQFIIGFFLGYGLLFCFRGFLPDASYFRRSVGLFKFLCMFTWKNFVANIVVTREVLTPTHHMTPGFLKLDPRAETPLEITWLAATISLIPGTLTVDTSEDDDYLYIHVMHIHDAEEIKREISEEIEPLILEFLRG